MFENFNSFIQTVQSNPPLRLAVAAAGDEVVIKSVKKADEMGIIKPILIGNKKIIEKAIMNLNYNFEGKIIETSSKKDAAYKAMELIAKGKADFPMKGILSTKKILKALLNKKYNLRQTKLLSFVTLIYLKKDEKFIFLTDGGMNIAPDLQEKVEIIKNAVVMAKLIGVKKPRVAVLAAIEKVNLAMPVTREAAVLSKMGDRGQLGDVIIDGPLAFDNAISLKAAQKKGIDSPVAGKADILLVPDIEAGNFLYKSLAFYSGVESASLVFGARVPVVLSSRADSVSTKFNSIVLGKLVSSGLAG